MILPFFLMHAFGSYFGMSCMNASAFFLSRTCGDISGSTHLFFFLKGWGVHISKATTATSRSTCAKQLCQLPTRNVCEYYFLLWTDAYAFGVSYG